MAVGRTLSISYLYFVVPERPRNQYVLIDNNDTIITLESEKLFYSGQAAISFQLNLQF